MLDAGADPNARQHGGFTPLHEAAQVGDDALADLLVERGADLTALSDEGKTPADHAVAESHMAMAARLTPS